MDDDPYAGLTLAGIVDKHVEYVHRTRIPETIRDHLLRDGLNDVPAINYWKGKLYKELKVNGQFHEHLGSTYMLSRSARKPTGFGDNPPIGVDKRKPDYRKATLPAPIRTISQADGFHYAETKPALVELAQTIARLTSAPAQQKLVDNIMAVMRERGYEKERREEAEERLAIYREFENRPQLENHRTVQPRISRSRDTEIH